MSSAKLVMELFVAKIRSIIRIRKSVGLSTEPWDARQHPK